MTGADSSQRVAERSTDPQAQDVVRWDPSEQAVVMENQARPDDPTQDVIEDVAVGELDQPLAGIGGYRWTRALATPLTI